MLALQTEMTKLPGTDYTLLGIDRQGMRLSFFAGRRGGALHPMGGMKSLSRSVKAKLKSAERRETGCAEKGKTEQVRRRELTWRSAKSARRGCTCGGAQVAKSSERN